MFLCFISLETTGSEEMSSSTYTRSQYSEDELVTPDLKSHVKETARETKGSIDLDALINESFKPSSFSGMILLLQLSCAEVLIFSNAVVEPAIF